MKRLLLILLILCAVLAVARTKRSRAVRRQFQIVHPCPSTGKKAGPCPGYIADHIIPLCKHGEDSVKNLQWQTVADAKAKDRIECKRYELPKCADGTYLFCGGIDNICSCK